MERGWSAMCRFYEVKPFVVSLSNHECTLRQAQGERDDEYDDDEEYEKEWCD